MEQSLKDLFNISIEYIYTPFLNALNEYNPFSNIYVFLNNLINGVLNMFGNNDNNIQININNELIAQACATVLIILSIYFVIWLFKKVYLLFSEAIDDIDIEKKKKGAWRSQWKRKK